LVGTDNFEGGLIATRHLLASGRRRVAFVGTTDFPEFRARYEGYVAAHREAGIDPGDFVLSPLVLQPAVAAIDAYLAGGAWPDGIVGATDVVAIAAIRALRGRGLSVPNDVSITGYNDSSIAAQAIPPLTTVRQDVAQCSSLVVDRLFWRIGGELCERVILTPELVIRITAP